MSSNDTLYGTAGDDFIYFSGSGTTAHGGAGDDYIVAFGINASTIYGDDGDDSLSGGMGNDWLSGGAGDDSLTGGGGADTLTGGAGNDTYRIDSPDDVIIESAGEGHDSVVVNFSYTLGANLESAILAGGNDANLTGNADGNTLQGNSGANVLAGGAGDDTLLGGRGVDTAVYTGNLADYSISYENGYFTIVDHVSGRDGTDLLTVDIEYFQFADGTHAASEFARIMGTPGDDDNLNGTWIGETLYGLAGNDYINGGAGNDTLVGGTGDDHLNGGDGFDIASYAESAMPLTLSLLVATGQKTGDLGTDTLVSIEGLIGGSGNDYLTGNSLANYLSGGAGNDSLNGGLGADTLVGGTGDDYYLLSSAGDVVVEEASGGFDVVYAGFTYALPAGVEALVLGGKAAANGTGNELDNIMVGNSAANVLDGAAGNDELQGLAGNDTLRGGDGDDTLNGGAGDDQFYGGAGNDWYVVDKAGDKVFEDAGAGVDTVFSSVSFVLGPNVENLVITGTSGAAATGNDLSNEITGNAKANVIKGGAGDDVLDGGLGSDALTGGAGSDSFKFSTALARNIDKITDFTTADDTIELDHTIFSALPQGVLSSSAFQAGPASTAASPDVHIIFNTLKGALFYDPDGLGGVAATQFATVVVAGLVGTVTAADFVVI